MRDFRAIAMCFWLASAGFSGALAADRTGADVTATPAGFEALFEALLTEADVPGAAFVVVSGGAVRTIGLYGVRSVDAPGAVTPETVFRLASVSKTVAATLAARLVENGDMAFTDKVSPHAPALAFRSSTRLQALTVDHLLSHRTGILPNAYDNLLEDGWGLEKILPRFKSVKPTCGLGDCYGYQNILFSLIEPVIEARTGRDYATLIRTELFEPLGMAQASVGRDAYLAAADRAVPHRKAKSGLRTIRVTDTYYRIAPAAGINASIRDMGKWLAAQMGHREDVISADMRATLTTPRARTVRELYKRLWRPHLKNAHYGYGWRIYEFNGETLILHGGAVDGFRSMIAYLPDRDLGLAMLMNGPGRVIDELTIAFFDSALKTPAPGTVKPAY